MHCGQSIDDRKNVIPVGKSRVAITCRVHARTCDAMDPMFMSHASTEQDPGNMASRELTHLLKLCSYQAVFKKINNVVGGNSHQPDRGKRFARCIHIYLYLPCLLRRVRCYYLKSSRDCYGSIMNHRASRNHGKQCLCRNSQPIV